jgi:hypothetical protein
MHACQRYEEMYKYATELVKDKSAKLNDEEWTVIANATKMVIAARKSAIRQINALIESRQSKGDISNIEKVKGYKKTLVD